jgi:hypothetical protein
MGYFYNRSNRLKAGREQWQSQKGLALNGLRWKPTLRRNTTFMAGP